MYFELPVRKFIDGTMLVADQTGRELRRVKIRSEMGEIDLGIYPLGIYFIVRMNKERTVSGKVIIQ